MIDWILQKYIGMLSTRLRNFKRKGPSLYNFSCPLCGDSEHNAKKARAYIYEKENKLLFHCHNCSRPMLASNFLKHMDQSLYDQYVMEYIKNNRSPQQINREVFESKMKPPVFTKSGPLKGLKKVSQLSPNDPIKKFVEKRKIPTSYHAKLFACPHFKKFVNSLIPNKFSEKSLMIDETRLLIPYFDADKNVFAFNARAIDDNDVRYIKIVLNPENDAIVFNQDTVDYSNPVYLFEGEFDAMFINNSLATGGGDLLSTISPLGHKDDIIIVYDNEPRSKETFKKINRAILNGYSVVIWPESVQEKDINEMFLNGMSSEYIEQIMKENTYHDLNAKMALTNWSKI